MSLINLIMNVKIESIAYVDISISFPSFNDYYFEKIFDFVVLLIIVKRKGIIELLHLYKTSFFFLTK